MIGSGRAALGLACAVWLSTAPGQVRATAATQPPTQTLQLSGVVTDAQRHRYLDVPFDVPEGTAEIAVRFDYDTREERTTLDLGLWGPAGFRGWSGGSRSNFTVAVDRATPGYLAGPIEAGSWRLVIGVPNVRDEVTATYTATVDLRSQPSADTLVPRPRRTHAAAAESVPISARDEPGWFRGDLHLHTEHSDGSCLVNGERAPCPLERTLAAARARGLDFIAVTEHNTVSHLPLLPASHSGLTVLPGQEVTTFRGHLNVIGIEHRLAFRAADGSPRDPNAIAAEARRLGAFVVINHPALPSGEACMGCGWQPLDATLDQVHAVEVINGGVVKTRNGAAEGLFSGLPFWQRGLSAGRSWIAIGASDNHDPDLPAGALGALGRPLTVVWARSTERTDLLDGLRSGRVFVDVVGHPTRVLDVRLRGPGGERAEMGGQWNGPIDDLALEIECLDCAGLSAELVLGTASGGTSDSVDLGTIDQRSFRHSQALGGLAPDLRWLRVDLRRSDRALVTVGNAIRLAPRSNGVDRGPVGGVALAACGATQTLLSAGICGSWCGRIAGGDARHR